MPHFRLISAANPAKRIAAESEGTARPAYEKALRLFHRLRAFPDLVEVAGVEPASESTLTGLSPGADDHCGGLAPPVPIPDGRPSRRQVR